MTSSRDGKVDVLPPLRQSPDTLQRTSVSQMLVIIIAPDVSGADVEFTIKEIS